MDSGIQLKISVPPRLFQTTLLPCISVLGFLLVQDFKYNSLSSLALEINSKFKINVRPAIVNELRYQVIKLPPILKEIHIIVQYIY